jgi:hypothetical protein
LGRTGEALDFHRRALVLRRARPHDQYRLAEAEADLADNLDAATYTGEPGEALTLRQAAHARLQPFDDPRAARLRARLSERLADTE